jgi:tRNA U34 5-carboxymethylaminomethyl modifying enzyme MnmG/GidA
MKREPAYDVIVVGAGHSNCDAAAPGMAARMWRVSEDLCGLRKEGV